MPGFLRKFAVFLALVFGGVFATSGAYAASSVTCATGKYLPANSSTCVACPAGKYCVSATHTTGSSSDQGISGDIAAGYYSTGGAMVSSPTSGSCLSGYSCGTVDGGYYSTGGGTSATPNGPGDGCLSTKTCGTIYPGYYTTCGAKGKGTAKAKPNVVSGCTSGSCSSGYSNENHPASSSSCNSCPSGWTTASDHTSCTKTITLRKNGGSGTIQGTSGTGNASITCNRGDACDFGSTSALNGSGDNYQFYGGWGTSTGCTSTTTSYTNPTNSTYYACKKAHHVITLDANSGTLGTQYLYSRETDAVYLDSNRSTNAMTAAASESDTCSNPLTVPTRSGYTFDGFTFYDDRDGTTILYVYPSGCLTAAGAAGLLTKDPTLTAQWNVPTYTVIMYPFSGQPIAQTIREVYGDRWYSGTEGTTEIRDVTPPTRNGYTFRGFFAESNLADLTSSGGTGTRYIDNLGELPRPDTFSSNTSLYGAWATDCIQPNHGSCTLTVNNDGTVTYNTTCDTGYVVSGNGTYNATCAPKVITVTLDSERWTSNSNHGTTGTSVSASPTPIYLKYNTGWYSDNSATTPFTTLSVLASYSGYYNFLGFYTEKVLGNGTRVIDANGDIVSNNLTVCSANCTLYAHYAPKEYMTTLNANGGELRTEYLYGRYGDAVYLDSRRSDYPMTTASSAEGTCTNPVDVPRRTNYTFNGFWSQTTNGIQRTYPSGCLTAAGQAAALQSNTTWYAHWEPNVYSVTLDSKHYTSASDSSGSSIGVTSAVPGTIYLKYNTGWYTDSGATTSLTGFTTPPAKTGYTFDGFYTGKAGTGTKVINANGQPVAGNTTIFTSDNNKLYAYYTLNSYTLDLNNGDGIGVRSALYTRYLIGLYLDSARDNQMTTSANPIPSNEFPVKAGYTFNGYYSASSGGTEYVGADGYATTSGINNAKNTIGSNTWYAQYVLTNYTISYTLNGGAHGANHPDTYDIETANFTISNPTRANSTFTGWTVTMAPTAWGTGSSSSGDTDFAVATGTYGNMAFSANWSCNVGYHASGNSCVANSYTVTFKSGNSTMATENFDYDESKALTAVATMNNIPVSGNGWTFVGWTTDVNSTTPIYTNAQSVSNLTSTDNGNVILYGIWSRDVQFTYYNSSDVLTTNTRTQYYRNTSASAASVTSVDTYALQQYSAYDWIPDGWVLNSTSETQTMDSSATTTPAAVTPAANVAAHYYAVYERFVAWGYLCNNGTGANAGASQDTQYYNSGANSANVITTSVWYNDICEYEGHDFSKWAMGSVSGPQYAPWESASLPNTSWNSASSTAFYAIWTLSEYGIYYDMNGGTNYVGAPGGYTYGTGATINGTPTRANSAFEGWTGSNGLTPQTTVTISTTDTGDKSYTANWLCDAGYYQNPSTACAAVASGYWSPAGDNQQYECPVGYSGSDNGRDENGDCYVTCVAPVVAHSTSVTVVNNKEYFDRETSAYPACTYNVTCDTGYSAQGSGTANPSCSPGIYKLGYTLNGGSFGTNHPGQVYYDEEFTVDNPTHPHATFAGWTLTDMNDTVTHYYGVSSADTAVTGATFVLPNTNITKFKNLSLYHPTPYFVASWTCGTGYAGDDCHAASYTVTYDCGDADGGTTPANGSATYAQSFTPAAASCTRTGYTFAGWEVSNTGNPADVKPASTAFTWNYTENKTFYAVWESNAYTITLSDGTGTSQSGAPGVIYENYDDNFYIDSTLETEFVGMTQLPIKVGYVFNGYWTGENGTGDQVIDENGDMVFEPTDVTSNITVYAAYTAQTGFSVTTTNLSAGTSYTFKMSAAGNFYVDWGDGTPVQVISRPSVTELENIQSHTYSTAGSKTFTIYGRATGYYNGGRSAISFANDTRVKSIAGSLGEIFGTIGTQNASFYSLFYGCSNLEGSIPSTLFSGLSGVPAPQMFFQLFWNCSKLTGPIPANLFQGPVGASYQEFFRTFAGCSSLTGGIDKNLFRDVVGAPTDQMFWHTFHGCSNLTGGIDKDLFKNLSGPVKSHSFKETFSGCSKLSGSIPEDLFKNITGTADYAFSWTFAGCSSLTGSIPAGLFRNISGPMKTEMFHGVFTGCSGLSGSIPANLFEHITGNATDGFKDAFKNNTGLSGYVPRALLPAGTTAATVTDAFLGSGLVDECPCGMTQYMTGAEDATTHKVGTKVSCQVGLKSGECWNNNLCTHECSAGFNRLKTGTGLSFPVLSAKTSSLNFVFKGDGTDTVCYVPTALGSGGLNTLFNGQTYHAAVPDGNVPAAFSALDDGVLPSSSYYPN